MFKPVSPKVDFVALEKEILDYWEKSGILAKYLSKNKDSKKRFSFLDGPITANNPMGVHHAWGRTYKDLWQRFFNMLGFKQRFQNGFDNQGLWVEVEVEKELGFKNKKDIEKYGIEKFVELCKQRTLRFAKVQTQQSQRLGYFMDWENSYYTMSEENNYMIWTFLKKCHQNGWLYKGRDTVPWCPRCGTAISQHEILTEEYQPLVHDSVFFELPLIDKDNCFFLVWTTTPWTIPANVALAVNPDLEYGRYENDGQSLILLKSLKGKILSDKWQLKETFKGNKMKGWEYSAPFDDLPRVKGIKHLVVDDKDLVTAEEGTGIVHIAPGAGHEDFVLGKKEKLGMIEAIDEEANYLDGFGSLSGKNAKDNPQLIIDYLKNKDQGKYLFKIKKYKHRYPVCWRCKTELVWRLVDEWYIAMDQLRPKMEAVTKKINWLPKWGLDRELDWLKNMGDWLISKKRYWGLSLPIWECECGHFEVIGDEKELEKKAVQGFKEFKGHSPHRPWIDKVKVKCSKCGKLASRILDVGNPWLDAGIVPFSTLKYRSDKDYWQDWFPADFITESFPGQFKNWFYSLIAASTVLENTNPFKTILGHGMVLGEDGQAMHKSLGNAIEFNQGAEKIGVDVMRWLYLSQNPADNLLFGYKQTDECRRRFHLLLWNIYNFFLNYAVLDNFKPFSKEINKTNVLDIWLSSKLNNLIKEITNDLQKYDSFKATQKIEDFVNDFSTWYVRRSRDRINLTAKFDNDKKECYQTYWEVLVKLNVLLAPFLPFLSESIYRNLTGKESVHLTDWPSVNGKMIDTDLEKKMKLVREICEKGHFLRKEVGIKVRQPLSKVIVKNLKLDDSLAELIMAELNIKKVEFKDGKGELKVELDTDLTPQLKAEGDARELVRQIQQLRKEAGCEISQKIKVGGPNWPSDVKLQAYIKKETLSTDLLKADVLKIID